MRILMIASEAAPFAKTGGLADVVGALPRALARLGHHVDLVLPRYRGITGEQALGRVTVPLGGQVADAAILSATVTDGVRAIFVDHPAYFDRDFLYGVADHDYADNAERFAFFARAALEWAAASHLRHDIVHGHDWQAGLVPVLLHRGLAPHPRLRAAVTVFTIHNLAYQGIFDASWLPRLGLGFELMHANALEYYGRISFLKGGILFSRVITTVSPQYAQEVQTPDLGFGFDGILRHRSADLVGILNGIDYDQWDPARDPHLPVPFDPSNLAGKDAVKRALLEQVGLPTDSAVLARPLVGMVSRLVDQKGFDLLATLGDELARLDASFVLLGSGERRYEDFWLGLAARHPGRIAVRIGFDEALAHRIEGGADLFLMPSRFEPCGLNQMYSLRYGTVPLVRATGGLVDTVENFDPPTGKGTGFTFDEYSPQALLGTLRWALGVYQDRAIWRRIQAAGMQQDLSWDASARQYVKVYERATGKVAQPPSDPATEERDTQHGIRQTEDPH
ncbi:MAG: glycogen synthase GlgA [Acidobacteria bacterium]|nr:glycogen synthase GlgA [Acidobacteriota bacterium]